jgi:hypothetical protein
MATFSYVGSGTVHTFGCAGARLSLYAFYKFAEGSTVFFCPKAKIGRLERITIKSVKLIPQGSGFKALYKDTLNALYNEDELCSEATAIELAADYFADQLRLIAQAARSCSTQC